MRRLNVWFVCLSLVTVSCALAGCTLEDPLCGDVENCGAENLRCIDVLDNASKVECKDLRGVLAMRQDSQSELQFQCSAVACADGYHTVEDGLVFKCERDDNMCDVDELCQSEGWKAGVCVKIDHTPTCISTACQAGYHLVPSTRPCPEKPCMQNIYCSEDTEDHCGGVNIRCRIEIDGWESGSCEEARCVVKSCATGRFASEGKDACPPITNAQCGSETRSCISPMKCDGVGQCVEDCAVLDNRTECNGVCVDTTSNSDHCGACDNACTIKEGTFADRMACSNSKCVIESCEPGYYLVETGDEVSCQVNDDANCGAAGRSCGTATCNTSTGTCETPSCNQGYYLDGSTCKANDQNNCGTKGKKCTVSNGTATCNTSTGTCNTTGCNTGYYLDGSTCKSNDQNNCGEKGKECTVSNGTSTCDTSTGMCNTTGCNTGYYLDGSTCKSNDQNNCGEKGKECTVSNGTATCDTNTGTCNTTGCNTGYYLDGSTCKTNDQNNCGTKGKKCTVSNGTATCDTNTGTCNTTGCNKGFWLVDGACVSTLVVGDEVEFGRYSQDENSDVPSPLTWYVVDVTEDSALLISKYVLEAYLYHDQRGDITWEQSNVRSYLNGFDGTHNQNGIDHTGKGFIDVAFNADERVWIKQVTNTNPNSKFNSSIPGGNDTEDKVFLLSHDEVLQYFPTNRLRIASPTAYAIHPPTGSGRNNLWTCQVTCSVDDSCSTSNCNDKGTNVYMCSDVQCSSYWWLRSPGIDTDHAAYINLDGGVRSDVVSYDDLGLRPALYIRKTL